MYDERYRRWRTSVDSSQVAVEDAASRQGSFLGLVSGRFVVADDVLQLVPDPAAMVREMARVVKPGGRVVVTTWEGASFPPDTPVRRLVVTASRS
jgi:2-polyprenyl-3-methyl-5-hydroxy-6-metoxy-1,4-benzoquinol methylase